MPLRRRASEFRPLRTGHAGGFFFENACQTLDSWYSNPIIRGSLQFRDEEILNEVRLATARKRRLEADAVAKHLPEI
jgi:hypothetical protein